MLTRGAMGALVVAAVFCSTGEVSRAVDFAARARVAGGGLPGIGRFKIKENMQTIPCGEEAHCNIPSVSNLLKTASNGPDRVSLHEAHTHYNFASNRNMGLRVMDPPVDPDALLHYALHRNPKVVTGHGRRGVEPHRLGGDAWESHRSHASYRPYDRHDPRSRHAPRTHNTRRVAVNPHGHGRRLNNPMGEDGFAGSRLRGWVMEDGGHVYQADNARVFLSPGA